jgi:hypothetical protein
MTHHLTADCVNLDMQAAFTCVQLPVLICILFV